MNFYKQLSPAYIPPSLAQLEGLRQLREKILQTMLIIFCVLGLPSVVFAVLGNLRNGIFALSVFYILIYILIIGIMAIRNLPYFLRAGFIVVVSYLLAVSELIDSGQLGEVRMFLVTFIALTAVLFSRRAVISSILLGLATIIGAGIITTIVPENYLGPLVNIKQGTDWITSSAVFLMIATMLAGSITLIISGLETYLNKAVELAKKLENERDILDIRIQERTQTMTRHVTQLRTAAEISRMISALIDREALLRQVTETVKNRLALYYVGIFILDDTGEYAVLKAGSGQAGETMVNSGHRLAVGGSSMIGWATANLQARIALDVGSEAVRFNNPLLPLTRSEIALPIIAHDEILGAMTIQSDQPNAFDENDIAILESISDSLAIALKNVTLYQETRESLEEIRALNSDYLQRAWAETLSIYGNLDRTYEFERSSSAKDDEYSSIVIPLTLRNEEIGQITLELGQQGLTEEGTSVIDNLSTQTAIALENARLLQETELKAFQEQTLNAFGSKFSQAVSIDDILQIAAKEFGELPAVIETSIFLDPNWVNTMGRINSNSKHNAAYRYRTGHLELIQNEELDRFIFEKNPYMVRKTVQINEIGNEPETILEEPIKLRGKTLGVVKLLFKNPTISQGQLDLIENAVNRLAVSLENTRLLEEIKLRAEQERKIGEISSKVRAASDIESVLMIATQEIGEFLGATDIAVQLRKDY